MRISLSKLLAIVFLLSGVAAAEMPKLPANFKHIEGRYHVLYYDITDDEAAEVMQRMEAMVNEYLARTRDFSGRLTGKMPFIMFRQESDYHAAGGLPGSAGVFIPGKALMAIAGEKLSLETWHVIQHEGFHQFVSNVIGGEIPIWVNEGMAEYFGEAIYTGDGFVSGAIPEYRLKRIQEAMKNGGYISVDRMMRMPHAIWNEQMKIENYDQAWSMVQFLAHGENGKYQKAFANYMIQVGRGIQSDRAWQQSFGSADGFEQRWTEFWTALPKNPTLALYARADAQMLASYAGRAAGQKQTFKTVDELTAAIKDGSLKYNPQDYLPKSLGDECVQLFAALAKTEAAFTLQTTPAPTPAARPPGGSVKCTLQDGTVITANFRTKGYRGAMSDVKVVEAPKKPADSAAAKSTEK